MTQIASGFLAVLVLAFVGQLEATNQFTLVNNCGYTVWPGLQGNGGKSTPENGGFRLDAGQSHTFNVDEQWGGRFWGRTDCDESTGHCVTGDCGNKIQCQGAGGVPPVSLAEFTLGGWGNDDFYDVSLVDGYNIQVQIRPIGNGKVAENCQIAGCYSDLNGICPSELQEQYNGATVACMSACAKFNTDQYCCRGAYGTSDTCKPDQWPTNYAAIFKSACPDAYSYAYDDLTSTFTCATSSISQYEVHFCP